MASAYAAAAVHVLPSWMETCGLVSLEAALAGAPLVGSTFGHELEYLEGDAWYADPENADSSKGGSSSLGSRAPSPTSNKNETKGA